MILVVGATGIVGSEVCGRLALGARGERVRAMVRATSDPAKVAGLRSLGIEVVEGDLREPRTLEAACHGVSAVITTVSAMPFTYVPGTNDLETTDLVGTKALIKAARAAGVKHFVYTSFSGAIDVDCPLTRTKRAVEAALAGSGMRYTILRPSFFMDVWVSPVAGFDFTSGKAAIYGDGDQPISWIAAGDVAEFAVRSLETEAAWNARLELGGPEALTPLEVVEKFEAVAGRAFETQHVPVEALVAQQAAAPDAFGQSFAALQRAYAQGNPIDMRDMLTAIPVPLTTITAYAERVLGKTPAAVG